MTFILALINVDFAMQISDRRLTYRGGKPPKEGSDKAIYFKTDNARLCVGYTGLAQASTFRTHKWLVEQLADASTPEHNAGLTLKRLRWRLSKEFRDHGGIRAIDRSDRRLTMMFSGYLDAASPPHPGWAVITNFQDMERGEDCAAPWDEFRLYQSKNAELPPGGVVRRVGAWRAMTANDEAEMLALLGARPNRDELVREATALVREIARRPAAQNSVGTDLSSITLGRSQAGPMLAFHSKAATEWLPAPAAVISTSGVQVAVRELRVHRTDVPPN